MATRSNSDQDNADEGADPSEETKGQNPGETTTGNLAKGGSGEGKSDEQSPA